MSEQGARQSTPMQGPRGTRDLYPVEAARRRWIAERWREVAVRHGFEEVDGPTFEESDLYAVKSGEGILGELFQAYSGKSPDEVARVRETGRAPYAMRPEFTPTLARMYAARAAGLPRPCKWFQIGPFFRAERPQRGRLREFLQWNCDVLGLDVPVEKWNAEDAESRAEVAEAKARMDAECIACCVGFLESCGLSTSDITIRLSDRYAIIDPLGGVLNIHDDRQIEMILALIDSLPKLSESEALDRAAQCGLSSDKWAIIKIGLTDPSALDRDEFTFRVDPSPSTDISAWTWMNAAKDIRRVTDALATCGYHDWVKPDLRIVRGLAYYTGTVFEVIAEGERAVAGGGRYDNLVELFGGPPTPAVGFAMGDVVLANLLQDKGLMPSDAELMGLVGQTPDVFVLSNGTKEAEQQVRPLVARLRRGEAPTQGVPDGAEKKGAPTPALPRGARGREAEGLHVRHSFKATKNVGKLLKEAAQQGARFAVIVESATEATVKNLRTGEQWPDRVPIGEVGRRIVERLWNSP